MDNFEKIQCAMSNLIRNVYNLDLHVSKGPRSNLNIANEIQFLTSYLMAIVFAVKMLHDRKLCLWNGYRSNANVLSENPCMTSYLTAIMFVTLVTISKLVAIKMCMTLTITFRFGEGQMQIWQSTTHMWLAIWF